MTDQQTEQTTTGPQLGDGGDLTQEHVNELLERLDATEQRAEAAEKAATDASGKEPRYAVYDKTFLKFVGGTHATKKAATDSAKAAKVKNYEIREV